MVAILLTLAALLPTQAEPAEVARIDALIKHVAELKDASFVRNGVAYDAATAAKFLKGKWDTQKNEIGTAEAFIEKVASKSSTTGKPYTIRFKDGKEVESRTYLLAELAKVKDGS